MITPDDWDKNYMKSDGLSYITPSCSCNCDSRRYLIYFKGDRTLFKDVPPRSAIPTVQLSVKDLQDLFDNLCFVLEKENQRNKLEKLVGEGE